MFFYLSCCTLSYHLAVLLSCVTELIVKTSCRLDVFIATNVPDVSRTKLKEFIQSSGVLCNGELVKRPSHILKENDLVVFSYTHKSKDSVLHKTKMEIDIVYEDDDLMVINKPPGLVVHPGPGHRFDTLVNGLLYHRVDLSQKNGMERPGIVHRLDKETSGLMLIAKNDRTHMRLAAQLEQKSIVRVYMALLCGIINPLHGTITTGHKRARSNRLKMEICKVGEGRLAITHYKTKKTFHDSISLVECRLETGRTHQIRLHMESKNTPILGDQLYGRNIGFKKNNMPEELFNTLKNVDRQMLHAFSIKFSHPTTDKEMSFSSDLPDDMQKITTNLSSSVETEKL